MALASHQRISDALPGMVYGNAVLGDATISSNQTFGANRTSLTATAGQNTATLGSAVFNNGDVILVWQVSGTGAMGYEFRKVISGGGTTSITVNKPFINSYNNTTPNRAQAVEVRMYKNYTVNNGVTVTIPEYNEVSGGVYIIACRETFTMNGVVNGDNAGHRGSTADPGSNSTGYRGGGTGDIINRTKSATNAGDGGGAGVIGNSGGSYKRGGGAGGAGGANGGNGQTMADGATGGTGGQVQGGTKLDSLTFGGGGGEAAKNTGHRYGGKGGGLIIVFAKNIVIANTSYLRGQAGQNGGSGAGGSGGGAGGTVLLFGDTINIGTDRFNLTAGAGGTGEATWGGAGGAGGRGKFAAYYRTSFTGSLSASLYGSYYTEQDASIKEVLGGGWPHFFGI